MLFTIMYLHHTELGWGEQAAAAAPRRQFIHARRR